MKTHTITTYECEICKTKHFTKADALQCESFPVEPCSYKLGEFVRVRERGRRYDGWSGEISEFSISPNREKRTHYVDGVMIGALGIGIKEIEKAEKVPVK